MDLGGVGLGTSLSTASEIRRGLPEVLFLQSTILRLYQKILIRAHIECLQQHLNQDDGEMREW